MGSWELPGYDVLDRVGSGRSGEVWRGRDRASGETVALKRVRCADPELSMRLRTAVSRLAELAAGPAGEHLVRVRATVPVGDGLVLVLDHAAGGSLASVLAARGRLAPGEVVTVGVPIAGVLATLHAAGVVHGHVTASNVLFTLEGRPQLADLGIAALLDDAADGPVPRRPPDDVYALAVLCWTALGGVPPAPGAPLPAAPAGVPSPLAAAVRAGLATDPLARPTAAAWGAALHVASAPAPVRLVRRPEATTPPRRQAPPAAGRTAAADSPPPGQPSPHRRRAPGKPARRPVPRVLTRALGAFLLAAAAIVLGTALSRVDRASTAAPLPRSSPRVPSAAVPTADWRQVLVGLDARRSDAFARGESLALARVYATGSAPLARDADALRRLVEAGVTAPGLRLEVEQVRPLSIEPTRVVLRVVDRLPAHDLIAADGSVRERRPGRGSRTWRIVLVRAEEATTRSTAEWRIAAVDPLS